MRRLFWQISSTLDGYMEGPGGRLDDTAQVIDADFERYCSEMLQSIDGIVLGRRTYDLFAAYWPTATGSDADRLNRLPKYVAAHAPLTSDWHCSRRLEGDLATAVRTIKEAGDGELAVFGSATLAASLLDLSLIDEIRLLVTPVLLSAGRATFQPLGGRYPLTLRHAETWVSGTVALTYDLR